MRPAAALSRWEICMKVSAVGMFALMAIILITLHAATYAVAGTNNAEVLFERLITEMKSKEHTMIAQIVSIVNDAISNFNSAASCVIQAVDALMLRFNWVIKTLKIFKTVERDAITFGETTVRIVDEATGEVASFFKHLF